MLKQLAGVAAFFAILISAIVLFPKARPGLVAALMGAVLVVGLTTLHAARYRLPTEGWAHWWKRVMFPSSRKGWKRYYCLLDCQHNVLIHSSRAPRHGDVAWCPAHHRTHAEQTRVVLVNAHADHGLRVVTGVVLDDDLIPDFTLPEE